MKKLAVILLAATFILSGAFSAMAHDLSWSCVGGTAAVDGIKEDAWTSAKSIEVKDFGAAGGVAGAWATVYTMHDNDRLYFYASVTDPKIDVSAADPGDGSARDCIGFCMDFDYNRTADNAYNAEGYTGNAGYINFGADGNVYFNNGMAADAIKSDVVYKIVTTATGYDVEWSISFKNCKDKMGIEFFVNDAQGDGARVTFANWNAAGIDSWYRTDPMGTIVFETYTAPAAVEAPAADAPAAAAPASPQTADPLAVLFVTVAVAAAGVICCTFKKSCVK